MDRLEVVLENHGKELVNLPERVTVVEKKNANSDGWSTIKVDIDWLKSEVSLLKSTDINSFWDVLELPPRVDTSIVPKGSIGVDVSGGGDDKKMIYHPYWRSIKMP